MDFERFIDNDFFSSQDFQELVVSAKKRQIEKVKSKMDDFYFSQNPLRKVEVNKIDAQKNKRA